MTLFRKVLIGTIIFFVVSFAWLGIDSYQTIKKINQKKANYQSINEYSATPTTTTVSTPTTVQSSPNKITTESQSSSTNSDLKDIWVGGILYKGITKEQAIAIENQQKASKTPIPFPMGDYSVNIPTPATPDISGYLPGIRFDTPVPTPTKSPCQKVFKVSKFMCIQTPDCVCY